MAPVASFPPLSAPHCRVLILGTVPGQASLRRQQYYAHPRNAFWPILAAFTATDPGSAYTDRAAAVVGAGIAVWDVLAACERPGSLDRDIDPASARPNDFVAFFREHPAITTVCCNGGTAAQLFRRHVLAGDAAPAVNLVQLPSTSPAHAGLPAAAKQRAWHRALAAALAPGPAVAVAGDRR
jgi:hypoxanthine-DNA glycosylase